MNKVNNFLALSAVFLLTACASRTSITVVDDLADEQTRQYVKESVWVVDHQNARRFDDPAWPAPIQLVTPKGVSKKHYNVNLFASEPSGNRIDVLYVSNGSKKNCKALTEYFGITAAESAFVKISNEGNEELYRCGSVIFAINPSKRKLKDPLINQYREIELLSKSEIDALDDKVNIDEINKAIKGKYPIYIRYIR